MHSIYLQQGLERSEVLRRQCSHLSRHHVSTPTGGARHVAPPASAVHAGGCSPSGWQGGLNCRAVGVGETKKPPGWEI
jgi:hypothetical protein